MPETPAIIKPLQQASEGLLFLSETDAPLVPFFWPDSSDEKLTTARFEQLAKSPKDAPIKTVKLDSFFRNATKSENWHNDEEKAQVERFKQLVKTIKAELKDVQVFRVGETSIDVYIVGQVEGGYAALQTKVVET